MYSSASQVGVCSESKNVLQTRPTFRSVDRGAHGELFLINACVKSPSELCILTAIS